MQRKATWNTEEGENGFPGSDAERKSREGERWSEQWIERGKTACSGFMGKSSFQWKLQDSNNIDSVAWRRRENMQRHDRSDDCTMMEMLSEWLGWETQIEDIVEKQSKEEQKEYSVCLSIGERGAEASEKRGRGRRRFFCVTEREWGKGDNASEGAHSGEPGSILTDSYSLRLVYMCVCIWEENGEEDRKSHYACKSSAQGAFIQPPCVYVRAQQQQHPSRHS